MCYIDMNCWYDQVCSNLVWLQPKFVIEWHPSKIHGKVLLLDLNFIPCRSILQRLWYEAAFVMNIIIIMGNPYCSIYLSIFNEHSQWPSLVVWFYDSPISDFPEASPLLRWNWVGSPVPKQSHFAYRRCGFFSSFGQEGKKNLGKLHDVFIPHAFQMLVYIVWIDGFRSQNYRITPLFRRNKSHSIHESGCLGNTTNESIECLISKQVPLLIGYILDGDTFHSFTYDACRWGLNHLSVLVYLLVTCFFADKP